MTAKDDTVARRTPKRDVLVTSVELHEAEERVAGLLVSLQEAREDLKWKQVNAKAARAALHAAQYFQRARR